MVYQTYYFTRIWFKSSKVWVVLLRSIWVKTLSKCVKLGYTRDSYFFYDNIKNKSISIAKVIINSITFVTLLFKPKGVYFILSHNLLFLFQV